MTFEPRDPGYESRVRDSFDKQRVMRTIGARLVEVSPGFISIALAFHEDFTQQHGYLHAGIITTAMDSACGYAALSLMAPDAAVLAIEFKVNFVAPAVGDEFVITGRVLKSGRTISVCTGEAHALNDGTQKLIAKIQATMMSVTGRDIND